MGNRNTYWCSPKKTIEYHYVSKYNNIKIIQLIVLKMLNGEKITYGNCFLTFLKAVAHWAVTGPSCCSQSDN